MQIRIEQLQGQIVQGQDVDADQVIRLSSEHRRLLSSLRLRADANKPAGDAALKALFAEYQAQSDATEAAQGS